VDSCNVPWETLNALLNALTVIAITINAYLTGRIRTVQRHGEDDAP
jgi:hypothetical protein